MAIPDFQTIMLPLLELSKDGEVHVARDSVEQLAAHFSLSEAERKELLPSGTQALFANRVAWARTYLRKAGLLDAPKRGSFQITERGRDLLREKPPKINVAALMRYPEFQEFRTKGKSKPAGPPEPETSGTPEEAIEAAYEDIRSGLAAEILQAVKTCSPAFFERLVVDLIVKMGYGGTRKDAGAAIGKTGDEGIDGIIKEDRLGLDAVYIQAKRWEGSVSRPEIQKFAGALQGQRAKKGIFITTSAFTKDAVKYVTRIDSKIILIDGETLAQYMIDFNVGVSTVATYELKKVDSDYFVED